MKQWKMCKIHISKIGQINGKIKKDEQRGMVVLRLNWAKTSKIKGSSPELF
jgi:hypothetical protein